MSYHRVQRCLPMRAVGLAERKGWGKMELRHLTTFRAVVKALGFTHAGCGLLLRCRVEVAFTGTSVSFLPALQDSLRGRPASRSLHPPHGLVQPCVICRYTKCVARPATGRPKTHARNHRVP